MPELTLGVLFPTGGDSRKTALECVEAARIAVERHTPAGWRVRIVEGDPVTPERAAAEAERVIAAGATVLVGTLRSELSLAASEVAERAGVVYWEAIASADEVTTRDFRRLFRVDGSATRYAAAGVDFAADVLAPLWGTRPADLPLATAAEETPFPSSFARAAATHARARGFPVVAQALCRTDVEDYGAELDALARARTAIVLSAGFHPMVARFWRQLDERGVRLRALLGISNWAFPRDEEFARDGYERVFAIAAPYLFSMDRSGLPPASRALLEDWWSRSTTPAAQLVAVDRDLVFTAVYVLLAHVLPRAADASPDAIAAAARATDIALGDTPAGYGVRFDETGDNQRSYAVLMQWQNGRRVTVHPQRFATAAIDPGAPVRTRASA